ncbi:MAG TPA: protein-L-isoaspartate(D-aspartate) O-methyltransferase [Pirellulales bacterium]|nr:protein-L-isoaspartate(D-aspartate) O-methyltransferase [Pirellulales bacterium]
MPRICPILAALSICWPAPTPLHAQTPDFAAGEAGHTAAPSDFWATARRRMVDEDVAGAGVKDERVLKAMRATPRHDFVTPDQRPYAYYDMCLPIGAGQTISPPFMVASMTERLAVQPTDKVLEVGTGSGYQAAVLSQLVKDVYTIEIVGALSRRAASTLRRLGYRNVHSRLGDGYQGWPQHAPYDRIIVTCSPERIPQPLVDQLREGGTLAIPVGERYQQTLFLYKKRNGELIVQSREPTMFVPMTGQAEAQRLLKPDPVRPALVNGGFEQLLAETERQPAGWYYVRQAEIADEPDLPEGTACLRITNEVPGRAAQALQGFGVDGEQVTDLDVSYWVRLRAVERGAGLDQEPKINVTFFDAERAPIGQAEIVAGFGNVPWTKHQGRMKVPRSARLAVVSIGLLGAVGEASFDGVELRAAPR